MVDRVQDTALQTPLVSIDRLTVRFGQQPVLRESL